jgi:uncharacterized membrane protein
MPDEVMPPEPPKEGDAGTTPPAPAPQGEAPPAPAPQGSTPPPAAGAPAESGGAWPPAGEVSKDDKTMAMLAWLLGIFSSFVGPLVIYLVKKDQSKFVAFHALQSLWFGVVSLVAVLIISVITCGIGSFLALAPMVVCILWCIKANNGEWAELPVIGGWAKKGL